MPKLGSVLGATRGGHKDAANSGRGGRTRGTGAIGSKSQSNRGATRGRGRGQARGGQSTASDAGVSGGKESGFGAPSSNSPFAAIKNDTAAISSPFGGPQNSSGFGKPSPNPGIIASNGFGAPSFAHQPIGNSVQSAKDPRHKVASQRRVPKEETSEPTSAGTSTPVDYQERYEKLKLDRVKQRENAIKQGQMADPNQPTLLIKAITPVGTCTTMCPEFERVERIVQKMVDRAEKSLDPTTDTFEVKELKMLKRFRRSAAGYDEQLPSDIRTPNTLLQTMNYLIRHVVSGPDPLGLIHKFVWDRTRSIRNDFSVQQLTKVEDIKIAVKCLERIARFHIVSLHLLSSPDNEEQFDHHQEREQLNNTMLSLMHYYDDNRERMNFPNEPEFRAYYIVLAIHDQRPDVEDRVQKWPKEILQSPKVQIALELLAAANNYWEYSVVLDEMRPNAISQGFYNRFFNLVDSPSVSYLMGCVAEIYFNNVRQTAIRSIWKAYCRVPTSQQNRNEEWTITELTRVLYFDDESQAEEFCEEQGLQLLERNDGALYLNWGTSSIDTVDFAPSSQHSYSDKYVEVKRGGRTLAAIILGLNIKQAAARGMIDVSFLPTNDYDTPIEEDENELFVTQEDTPMHQEPPTLFQIPRASLQPTTEVVAPQVTSKGPFEAFQPPAAPVTTQATTAPNIFSSSGPAKPLFAPSSLFAPFSDTSIEKPSSPFHTPTPTSIPFQGTASTNPPKPLFSWPASTQSTSTTSSTLSTTTTEPPKTNFSWPAASQSSGPVFKAPEPAAPITEPKPSPLFRQSPFSTQEAAPEVVPAVTSSEAPNLLFSFPPSSQPSKIEVKAPGISTTTQASESLLNKTPSPFAFQPPSFSTTSNIFKPAQESIFSKLPPQKSPITITPTEIPPPTNTSKPLFSSQPDKQSPSAEAELATSPKPQVASQSLFPFGPPAADADLAANGQQEQATEVDQETEVQSEQEQAPVDEFVAKSPLPKAEAFSKSESFIDESSASRRSWIETLRQSAIQNRASKAGKKRPLEIEKDEALQAREEISPLIDEPQVHGQHDEETPKPKRAAHQKQKKTSLALASIAPLPTLPILERVKELTKAKPPRDDETVSSRTSQIDEDEMILSAARIAAEQLKNGPRLFDGSSDYTSYTHPFRSSTFGRSVNSDSHLLSSLSSSVSSSSPYARVNGYDVALAPETPLGLGRTLSRTEQRLRLTGGKGLAYKPLQLTPEKATSSKQSNKKRSLT
ncbi:leucine permease transcriptional regulator (SAC3), putative [Talaromyces stipitatus ATCC 10500]|uniref:Leucine permease transcriptional regulator (SAC3), putative n=1 Tax=Talaromyces stipitatus (strain ATCC 10500 / CBS 375.48 / QM 6759 / NRRL 1006) TaxID=441959 RepID=B8M9X1_TALSN|nr:leucine permease transcriptional regulator (SAC3), putative [Talaromyces stipitatus ATCC 10500]EED18123.1 leucine permease transcriptional regulator (SAC3), putative [Talaromyces stipitatus ATCC 10500]